jgi:hypothetical protein
MKIKMLKQKKTEKSIDLSFVWIKNCTSVMWIRGDEFPRDYQN